MGNNASIGIVDHKALILKEGINDSETHWINSKEGNHDIKAAS